MITKEELNLLCELSKLRLTEDEYEKYGKEMTGILELMDTIGESDFQYELIEMDSSVPFSALRSDTVQSYENMSAIVANGPEVDDNQFAVPKIVD